MDYDLLDRVAKRMSVRIEFADTGIEHCHGICEYWDSKVIIDSSLPEEHRAHVLLHELAHVTGSKERLDRETLTSYGSNTLYALVEEMIAESTAVAILKSFGLNPRMRLMDRLGAECDAQGIEWEHDIEPEVERIIDYLSKHFKEVYECQ